MLLEKLGIYGWRESEENLLLTSLLTGDPLLLIGPHGCAKTYLASRIAQAMGRRFVAYDASKAMFEDVLGYPNLEKLKQGTVDYVPGPLTIWDKEMILIDELNRALPEMQSKWLEIVRSRRIMGLSTRVRWAWAAMNPHVYAGTQALDRALLGRFALYVCPPTVLEMSEADRIKVTQAVSDDDAPALNEWLEENVGEGSQNREVSLRPAAQLLTRTLRSAARHYRNLREDLWQLPLFLSRLAELLRGETQGEISLDGRRLGFLYRNILAYRSIELARAELAAAAPLSALGDSARLVIEASIPLGLDDSLMDEEKARHQLELCCDLLSDFFKPGSELSRLDAIYELCTTHDLRRKAQILLEEDLGDLVKSRGWQQLVTGERDITPLAYIALRVEACCPGTIPPEILGGLSRRISVEKLSTRSLQPLRGEEIEYLDQVEGLLHTAETDLEKVVTLERIRELTQAKGLSDKAIRETEDLIRSDVDWLNGLLARRSAEKVA